MNVNYRYEEFGEAYLFFIKPIFEGLPQELRESYRLRFIQMLKNHTFQPKKKRDPAHPRSVEARKERGIEIKFKDSKDPEQIAMAVITSLEGYYLAPTQIRVKNYIIKNL
ncbi:MAG: hypothetical protein KKF68_01050 [Nanoarchaeota archaeon]|nr:hypothetical protein [Nanoarchaeota archaeon]